MKLTPKTAFVTTSVISGIYLVGGLVMDIISSGKLNAVSKEFGYASGTPDTDNIVSLTELAVESMRWSALRSMFALTPMMAGFIALVLSVIGIVIAKVKDDTEMKISGALFAVSAFTLIGGLLLTVMLAIRYLPELIAK